MSSYGETERKKDFEYFIEHYQELYEKYGHKFIAIKNKTVLGVYNSEIAAMDDISKQYPLGTFIIQECNGDESGYTNYISSWQIIGV